MAASLCGKAQWSRIDKAFFVLLILWVALKRICFNCNYARRYSYVRPLSKIIEGVNTFVVFSGEKGLQICLSLHFSRFSTLDRFEISQRVVKTAFVAA